SLMQGVELVNRLVLGEPESTIGIKYESTTDGRNAAHHERSAHAGSGDPKKALDRGAMAASSATVPTATKVPPDHLIPTAKPGQSVISKVANAIAKAVPTNNPGDKDEVHVSEEEL